MHLDSRAVAQRRLKWLLPLLALLLGSSQNAFAAWCSYSPAGPAYVTITLPASLTVAAGAAVGTVLWSGSTGNTALRTTTCSGNWYPDIAYVPGVSMAATSVSGVYATNVPGIGVKVVSYGYPMPAPGTAYNSLGGNNSYGPTGVGSYLSFTLSLVLTGPVGAGGVVMLPSPLAGGYSSTSPTLLVNEAAYGLLNVSGSTQINHPGCTTSNVNVPMGKYSIGQFSTGIGGTTASVPFQIQLTCPANWNGINYRIDAVTTVVSSSAAVVALDASSSASGVGIQLLDSQEAPMTAAEGFQKAVPLGSTPGSQTYNKTAAGTYTIPLRARYYQTGTTVSPGNANSSMTFTITYQ